MIEKKPVKKEEIDELLEEALPNGKPNKKDKKKRISAFKKLMRALSGPLDPMFGHDLSDEDARRDAESIYGRSFFKLFKGK